jgi:hypothetical protein
MFLKTKVRQKRAVALSAISVEEGEGEVVVD